MTTIILEGGSSLKKSRKTTFSDFLTQHRTESEQLFLELIDDFLAKNNFVFDKFFHKKGKQTHFLSLELCSKTVFSFENQNFRHGQIKILRLTYFSSFQER